MKILRNFLLLVCIGFFLASCSKVYFKYQQPADSKDLKRFPKELRGVWNIDKAVFTVDKDYFQIDESEIETLELVDLDPDIHYEVVDGVIYLKFDTDVSYGTVIEETPERISYMEESIEQFWLGNNCSIRKLGKNYLLNIRDEDSQWWELYLIIINDENDILVKGLDKDNTMFIPKKDLLNELDESNEYVIAKWTTKFIQEQISNGAFKDTAIVLKQTNRIK